MSRHPAAPPRERAGLGLVLVVVLVLALLCGGGYAAAYVGARDRLPRDTTVAGVRVGGRTPAAAARALQQGLADRVDAPITVHLGLRSLTVTPHEAGLSIDYAASVDRTTPHRGWDARGLWSYYTDGTAMAPVIRLDPAALRRLVARLDHRYASTARNGRVTFGPNGVTVQQPVSGSAIDQAGLRESLASALLADPGSQRRQVDAILEPVTPTIDAADVRHAVVDFANPALSGSVLLHLGGRSVRLQPRDFRRTLSVVGHDGTLSPHVDAAALTGLVPAAVRRPRAPTGATVRIVHGAPVVVPARPGVSWSAHAIVRAFLRAAERTGAASRVATVTGTPIRPGFLGRDARRLGITSVIATATVPLAAPQVAVVGREAGRLDNAVIRPGGSFSFRGRIPGAGHGDAPLATAVYAAALDAGLQITGRHAPAVHQVGFPAGRDATVATGDLTWRDDTHHGVLVSVAVAGDAVKVTLWSTPTWVVRLVTGAPSHVVRPQPLEQDGPGCTPRPGRAGFDVDVVRTLTPTHGTARPTTETTSTHYLPQAAISCKP